MLNKVVYTDDITVVEAQNMNDIQDEILKSVSTDVQTLTAEQKNQAKANLGIDLTDIGKLTRFTGNSTATASVTDFNDLLDTGIWYCEALDGNKPASSTYYYVIVLRPGTNLVKQIAMTATTNHMYVRSRNQNSVWSDWYTVF